MKCRRKWCKINSNKNREQPAKTVFYPERACLLSGWNKKAALPKAASAERGFSMSVIREEIGPGIHANFVPADSFKSRELTVNFIVPLSRETAARDALLPSVLLRGTRSYPNLTALQRKLASLYDAHIGGHTGKRGEAQILTFSAGMLNDDCIPDQTDVFGETLKVFGEVRFEPLTENGVFSATYVESEKRYLADAIRAKINNKNNIK